MVIKYNIEIKSVTIKNSLKKLTNQIYKLLPNREEGVDWTKPLETIIEELAGMDRLFIDQQDIFFPLLCKLEGLFTLTKEEDFGLYRRIIFECLGLISELMKICQD
jgi:hypothetical protein